MVNSKLEECGLTKVKKVGLKEIKTIQNKFPTTQIMVIDKNYKNLKETPMFLGKNRQYIKHVFILYSNNYYDVITSI